MLPKGFDWDKDLQKELKKSGYGGNNRPVEVIY
jgi:hypothetical protein